MRRLGQSRLSWGLRTQGTVYCILLLVVTCAAVVATMVRQTYHDECEELAEEIVTFAELLARCKTVT